MKVKGTVIIEVEIEDEVDDTATPDDVDLQLMAVASDPAVGSRTYDVRWERC